MSENFIKIPSSLKNEVKITREPDAGNGWGETVITVPGHIKVAFEEKTRPELVEVNDTLTQVNEKIGKNRMDYLARGLFDQNDASELSAEEVDTLIKLVNNNVSEFTEEFATKLNDGFEGTSTDSIASAERGLNRIKYLEGIRDKLLSQYVHLEK